MEIDIILVVLIALAFYAGYNNGIFGISLKIVLFFGAILLALNLFPIVFLFMENTFTTLTPVHYILGFVLVLATIFVLYRYISKKIESWVKANSMRLITRISGGIIISLFVLLLFSFISGRLERWKIVKHEAFENSILHPAVDRIDQSFSALIRATGDIFGKTFERNIKTINDIDGHKKEDPEKADTTKE